MDHDAATISRTVLDELLGGVPGIAVQLWDGSRWPEREEGTPPRATLVLRHPGALRSMFLSGTELRLAEAYLYDDFDVEGDLEAAINAAATIPSRVASWRARLRLAQMLRQLPSAPPSRPAARERGPAQLHGRKHSVQRDREAIAYHYDVSNDFYRLFLDDQMVYSCAYFQNDTDPLNVAQSAKLDLICRKLRLQPGQRLLDVGCGWGGLVLYAAQHYGVEATGITLSEPQVEEANLGIAAAGMQDHARVLLQDYREIEPSGTFDALVSVGMFEHVGKSLLPTYFRRAFDLVRPGGVFLNHGIARGFAVQDSGLQAHVAPLVRGRSFSDAYVFPDGELLPIGDTLRIAERVGWEVRDVESLREHYALTLRHWVRRLESHHDEALRYVSEPTYRVWRLFMAGSAAGFTTGRLSIFQALLVRTDAAGSAGLPLTRADWYRPDATR